MPIKFRTAAPDDRWIDPSTALDENRVPNVAYVKSDPANPYVVWWFTNERGHVTEVVLDTRRTLRHIHAK